MAIAEAHLAARYNRPGHALVDHHTYVIAGDGDLMEGISAEACALAGHLGLGKLIVLYDDNRISLAGSTDLSFTEDVKKRFEAQGWHVERVSDGNDLASVSTAIDTAKAETKRPSLIMVKTVIGDGAPHKEGSFKVHGSPSGREELAAAKAAVGWPTEPMFYIPAEVLNHFRKAVEKGEERQNEWEERLAAYDAEYPDLAREFTRRMEGRLPDGWDVDLPDFPADPVGIATRKASEAVLQAIAVQLPELVGGSADLNPSTYTWLKGCGDFEVAGTRPDDVQGAVGDRWGYTGRNIHYGVREHAMGAISNGMAAHGGMIPYTATFLTFADYMRAPIRLAALSKSRVVFVFTHDSIGVGEDGPTHQPVEQVMNLRAVPNLTVIRPSDANEVREAWQIAVENESGPTALIFSRQKLPILDRNRYASAKGLARGGYILWESKPGTPDLILIGTGSEIQLVLAAGEDLGSEGVHVRVVALPSWEIFDRQPREYRENVLPSAVRARIAVEAGSVLGWETTWVLTVSSSGWTVLARAPCFGSLRAIRHHKRGYHRPGEGTLGSVYARRNGRLAAGGEELPCFHDRREGIPFWMEFEDSGSVVADRAERSKEVRPVDRSLPREAVIVLLIEVVVQVHMDQLTAVAFEVVSDRLSAGVL